LIGEGIVPSRFIERLAARVPVVIFAAPRTKKPPTW